MIVPLTRPASEFQDTWSQTLNFPLMAPGRSFGRAVAPATPPRRYAPRRGRNTPASRCPCAPGHATDPEGRDAGGFPPYSGGEIPAIVRDRGRTTSSAPCWVRAPWPIDRALHPLCALRAATGDR